MTSERAIPHLRDIFSLNAQSFHHNGGYVEVQPKQPTNYDLGEGKKTSPKKKKDNYKTLTCGDVKTLERHLSMKKTIRKKIMRDLQQAFVEDPNEFKTENTTPEQMKAELSAEAVKFGEKHHRKTGGDPNFLDMLRGETRVVREDVDRGDAGEPMAAENAATNCEKTSFWRRFAIKSKNKR